jgi:hypothetical protein
LLGDIENTVQVDVQDAAPYGRRNVHEGLANADPRIIDENVQPSKELVELFKSLGHAIRVGHICRYEDRQCGQSLAQALARGFVPVNDSYSRPLANKTLRGSRADASGAACNQNSFTG